MALNHPRVAQSDFHLGLVVELAVNMAMEPCRRNLTITHSYPRRQVLMLDPEWQAHFISVLRRGIEVYTALQELDSQDAVQMKKRSIFNKVSVQQLCLCMEAEGWNATGRTAACPSLFIASSLAYCSVHRRFLAAQFAFGIGASLRTHQCEFFCLMTL